MRLRGSRNPLLTKNSQRGEVQPRSDSGEQAEKNWPAAKNMYRSTAMDEKVEKEAVMPSFFFAEKCK
jgi:hypothetical protein